MSESPIRDMIVKSNFYISDDGLVKQICTALGIALIIGSLGFELRTDRAVILLISLIDTRQVSQLQRYNIPWMHFEKKTEVIKLNLPFFLFFKDEMHIFATKLIMNIWTNFSFFS